MFVWRPFNLPKTLRLNLGSSGGSGTGPVVGKGFLVPSVGNLIGSVRSVGNVIGSVTSVGEVGSSIRSYLSTTSKKSSPSIVLMALSRLRMAWASSGEG